MTAARRGYEVGLMILFSVAFGFVFFDRNALNYLSPFVARDLHLSNTQIGTVSWKRRGSVERGAKCVRIRSHQEQTLFSTINALIWLQKSHVQRRFRILIYGF